jgi:hypothetical protein
VFILTDDFKKLVNLDHVSTAALVKHDGKCDHWVLSGANGERLGETSTDLEFATTPVVMAQPGFVVLKYWYVDEKTGEDYFDVSPVLAWRVISDGFFSIPVLLEDSPGPDDKFVVERPDGRVILPGDPEFTNRAEWLRHARSENEKEKSANAAKRKA